jgi:enoyl-CoA hydratase/carnithine racemase
MPSLFTEIIRYAVGTTSAAKATLSGKVYSGEEALSLGLIDSLTSQDKLLAAAIAVARRLAQDCNTAYAFSKEALQAPTLKRIHEESDALDRRFGETWCSNDAQSATARTYKALKGG